MFGRVGVGELVLILAIALIIFGPAKLPEIGKVLGDAVRNFKKHSDKLGDELGGAPAAKGPASTQASPRQVGVTLAEDREGVQGQSVRADGKKE